MNHGAREDEANVDLSPENGFLNCNEDFGRVDGACGVVVEKSAEPVENIVEKSDVAKVPCSECELNRKERNEYEEKYKALKKQYYKLAVHHSELDLKHKDLKDVATAKTNENIIGTNAISAASDIFTPNELKYLQCMSLEKDSDSTFVLHCMKFAYKQQTSVLKNKSRCGTKGRIEFTEDGKEIHHPAKEPLTPHKVDRIRGMFIDRISKCEINSVEYGVRMKPTYVNQHIASAIKNICNKRDTD